MYGEPDYDYFREPTAFEQEIDNFKEALRQSVKDEITAELEGLRRDNAAQAEKLANLKNLELEADQVRIQYERKRDNAEREARTKVEHAGIRKLLAVLAEPRYRVKRVYHSKPKCEHCDEHRTLTYLTPMGRTATEQCECAMRTMVWEVEEQMVHEITKRRGDLLVWYKSTASAGYWGSGSDDTIGGADTLKPAAGVPDAELMDMPTEYGFASEEDAQRIADALNKAKEEEQDLAKSATF